MFDFDSQYIEPRPEVRVLKCVLFSNLRFVTGIVFFGDLFSDSEIRPMWLKSFLPFETPTVRPIGEGFLRR